MRGNIFGSGEFDLNDDWRATFSIHRSSDITYLLRYGFPSGQDYLPSYGTLEYFHPNSYGNITAMGFQSLVAGRARSILHALRGAGRRLHVGDAARQARRPADPGRQRARPDQPSGISERRLSGVGDLCAVRSTALIGDRFELRVSVRGDGYYSTDLPDLAAGPMATQDAFAARFFPQAALPWRYPWVRHAGHYTELIEPVVMAVVAPDTGNYSRIPNQDSQAFEFDDTDLFVPNRFTGYDLVDTGQRVDYGLRGGIYADNGASMRFLVGPKLRVPDRPGIPARLGPDRRGCRTSSGASS